MEALLSVSELQCSCCQMRRASPGPALPPLSGGPTVCCSSDTSIPVSAASQAKGFIPQAALYRRCQLHGRSLGQPRTVVLVQTGVSHVNTSSPPTDHLLEGLTNSGKQLTPWVSELLGFLFVCFSNLFTETGRLYRPGCSGDPRLIILK